MIRVRAVLNRNLMWTNPLDSEQFAHELGIRDVEWIEEPGRCDVLFHDSTVLDVDEYDCPTVIFDNRDLASLSLVARQRANRSADFVKAIVKPLAYQSLDDEVAPHSEFTLFGAQMLEQADRSIRPSFDSPKPLEGTVTRETFDKIIPINHYFFTDQHFKFHNFDLPTYQKCSEMERPIDVLFVGSEFHYWPWAVRRHRFLAVQAIRDLPHDVLALSAGGGVGEESRSTRFGSLPTSSTHFDLMRLAKIVVSPFGFSEISSRDAEADFAGCVIIKPENSVRFWPHFSPYVTTKIDFSDLADVVEKTLLSYASEIAPNITEARKAAIALRPVWKLAEWYADLFKKVASS